MARASVPVLSHAVRSVLGRRFAQGRLSTRADCNVCSGEFALSGQTLTAGPALACTRAACPTMAFENDYTRLLGGNSMIALSGDTLALSSERGVLRFRL
jgi:heat shock protein HslJ